MRNIAELYNLLLKKLGCEVERIGDGIPHIADVDSGKYDDKTNSDICWWTNGFWPGILWQLFYITQNESYKNTAEIIEQKLDRAFSDFLGLHHDVGFMWLPSSGADYKLTGNAASRKRLLHAATLLAGRFNPNGNFIRCWNEDMTGWIIVDSMININLLYQATEDTGDPRFRFIAERHADTVMRTIVRKDGSCNHIAVLDPNNGKAQDFPAGQGYASGSAWTRGQSWALYGFALSYTHTHRKEYLETALKVADFFLSEEEKCGYKTPVDFRQPANAKCFDSTAGCIAACGLLELADILGGADGERYKKAAKNLIYVTDETFCDWDMGRDGVVGYGTMAYNSPGTERHVPIIYGDYFFTEAVLRLSGKYLRIW